MIEKSESSTAFTGEHVMVYRILAVRRGLILKIDTGLNAARKSALSVARHDGITTARTARGALRDVNNWLTEHGASAAWSKTYPEG